MVVLQSDTYSLICSIAYLGHSLFAQFRWKTLGSLPWSGGSQILSTMNENSRDYRFWATRFENQVATMQTCSFIAKSRGHMFEVAGSLIYWWGHTRTSAESRHATY